MKLPTNVKVKSRIWNLIPWLSTANGIYPNVYLPKSVYENLKSGHPSPRNTALLMHEEEHVKREKEFGVFKWILKYVFIPKFRFTEEIAADVPKLKFLKSKNLDLHIEKRARELSGWLYFWPVSYKTAKEELEKIGG